MKVILLLHIFCVVATIFLRVNNVNNNENSDSMQKHGQRRRDSDQKYFMKIKDVSKHFVTFTPDQMEEIFWKTTSKICLMLQKFYQLLRIVPLILTVDNPGKPVFRMHFFDHVKRYFHWKQFWTKERICWSCRVDSFIKIVASCSLLEWFS